MIFVTVKNPLEYFRDEVRYYGVRKLLKLTNKGERMRYPRILALGYYSQARGVINVCKLFNWKLRTVHELGHFIGEKHLEDFGNVMHPLGVFRRNTGARWILNRVTPQDVREVGTTTFVCEDAQKWGSIDEVMR